MVERSLRTGFHTVEYEIAIGTGIDAPHLQSFGGLAVPVKRLQSANALSAIILLSTRIA
jgi:hypothetical protein